MRYESIAFEFVLRISTLQTKRMIGDLYSIYLCEIVFNNYV